MFEIIGIITVIVVCSIIIAIPILILIDFFSYLGFAIRFYKEKPKKSKWYGLLVLWFSLWINGAREAEWVQEKGTLNKKETPR
jgi:hypothetical protein